MNATSYKRVMFALVVIVLRLADSVTAQSQPLRQIHAKELYRVKAEQKDGFAVWIVDGAKIREDLYPEFVYGGNEQRYPFVPKREIWIDHAITCEEYRYTLAHELLERDLMAKHGLTYGDAHDSALQLEDRMRLADSAVAAEHERALPLVSAFDNDTIKELSRLPDSIRLHSIYLQRIDIVDGNEVWIVNGANVRRDIYPDFGFSGNDLVYYFIPHNEIWIDNAISCEETNYSILSESRERQLMLKGVSYDSAYETALAEVRHARNATRKSISSHPKLLISGPLDRDTGTGNEQISEPGATSSTSDRAHQHAVQSTLRRTASTRRSHGASGRDHHTSTRQ